MSHYKEKELVTLRSRLLQNGSSSLYLDYSLDGIRTREFLHLYLVEEKTKLAKLQNAETMKTALALKAKRTVAIQNGEAGFKAKKKDMLFTDFLQAQKEDYLRQGKTEYAHGIGKILAWVKLYGKRESLRKVDKEYIVSFLDFVRKGVPKKSSKDGNKDPEKKSRGRAMNVEKGLSEASVYQYYQMLGTLFNNAVRQELVDRNPLSLLSSNEKPHKPESEREYLTYEEVKKLIETPCGNAQVKSAFLFACFTGLRLGDIEHLTWKDIRETDEGREVGIRMGKTKKMVYVPLSANAESFLPKKGRGTVWDLCSRTEINANISRWVKAAGIRKKITFHCSRHTYATLLLTYGADLYTVSKLMGHSDIGVTQVYAKIIDKKKQEAVNLIPKLD